MSLSSIPPDARRMAAQVLAFTLGDAAAAPQITAWHEFYEFSVQQRCAALMWQRSGAAIRTHAPADVVAAWRHQALAIAEHGSTLLRLLAETQALLGSAGVESIAIKGPPLALRLYGAPIARPIGDLDLYIPASQRQRAREVLVADGWIHTEGGRGTEWEVLMRMDGEERRWLDLLSRIPKQFAGGNPAPPESEVAVFDGMTVRAHSGPGVPNHLAVHLAKHDFPPLLWFLDFATAWDALPAPEQAEARVRAQRMEIQRYLRWAVDRADGVKRAAAGDAAALGLLGFTATGRTQPRRWRRELALAGSVSAAFGMLLEWIFPRPARTPVAFMRLLLHRLRHPGHWLVDRRRFELKDGIGASVAPERSGEST